MMLMQARQRDPKALLRVLPRPAPLLLLVTFMVAMGLTYLSTLFGPDGTPEKHDGRYYENDKGELTEISHDEYRRGQAWDQRRMSSIRAAFYALGTAAAFAAPKFLDRRPPPPIDRRPPASVTRNPHLDSPR